MDRKKIEELAAIAVKGSILKTDTLSQFITENDKTPSWDGYILLYNDSNKKKSSILGRVDVQVKGELSSNFQKKEISHSADVADLINYKNGGGAIYFVVNINKKDYSKTKIYYDALTPVKLDSILNNIGNKKHKTIYLKEFPNDKHAITTIFFNFYQDSIKQYSFKDIPPLKLEEISKRNDVTEIIFSTTIFTPSGIHKSPIDAFHSNDIYLYAKIGESPIPHPIECIGQIEFSNNTNFPILVDSDIFYENAKVSYGKDYLIIKIGDSITITIDNITKKSSFKYKPSVFLSHRIKDLDFIIHLAKHHQINFGEQYSFPISDNINKFIDIESSEQELFRLKKIQIFLNNLHIVEDLKIENINWKELYLFIDSVNTGMIVNANHKTESTFNFYPKTISNLIILFLLEKQDHGESEFKIYDFFNNNASISVKRNNERVLTSCYTNLEPNNYNEYSNINFSGILQSFKDLVPQNPYIYECANLCLLNLLLAYDNATFRKEIILKTAKGLSEWILRDSEDVIAYEIKTINYLQVIKRERELSQDEIILLIDMVESPQCDSMCKTAAYLLLDNQHAAYMHFKKLQFDQQEQFKTFPIYSFWK